LDIRAELQRNDLRLTLIIECKKNNPSFVNWIFFPKSSGQNASLFLRHLENVPRVDSPGQWKVGSVIKTVSNSLIMTDEARETRGSYLKVKENDRTKTSNAAVTEAAYQVALATQAIAMEEKEFSKVLGASNPALPMTWREQVILPMIITTARLYTCEFDAGDVSPKTGEIPLHKASLVEQSHLFFEYPIPRHLQVAPKDLLKTLTRGKADVFIRQHIMIVQSESLRHVLANIAKGEESWSP